MTTDTLADRIWFNTAQAAVYTGWSVKTVVRALQAEELKGQQRGTGRRWRIHRDWLDSWMAGEKA